jgi:heme-degrading monooxygenase HmoA
MDMDQDAPKKPPSTDDPQGLKSQIRQRAFELYQERGREAGHELDDWLLAEEEITGQRTRIAAWLLGVTYFKTPQTRSVAMLTADSFHPQPTEGAHVMFTRIVELTTKPGKNKQLSETINDKVLPILKKQKGFVDETVLVSDQEDSRVVSLSFWKTRADAEEYHRAEYQRVKEIVQHLLEAEPTIRTFDVHSSTIHKITVKAAWSKE